MPREPIVVLHTALTNEISKTIQSIVAHPRMYSEADAFTNATVMGEDPQKITTAVFYSITTSQKGFREPSTLYHGYVYTFWCCIDLKK